MTSPFDELGLSDVVLGEPKTRAEAVAMWFNDPVRLQQWLDEQDGLRWVMWDYEFRHPGHADQSVHNPHKGRGAGSGLGEYKPGVPRPGAGDGVAFPAKGSKDYDEFMAGSMREHVVLDADGNITGFTPERQALHDKIVADHVLGVAPASGQPEMVMMGGGSGAGKSTLLKSGEVEGLPGEGSKTHVLINPDDIKTGENGKTALPEFKERAMGTDPVAGKGAAGFVHEESSYLGKRVQAAAIERNQNILLDGTGDSSATKLSSKIGDAKTAGYKVKGVYVTVPTEVAVRRVRERGAKPLYEGANFGRVVADDVTRDIHISVSRVLPEVASRGVFDSVELWDTSASPVLVFSSAKGGVQRNGLWKGFLAKGYEKLSTEKPKP
jgi:predicted ABC-type ATPase